jgi:putative phosphoribosyl transferase
MDRSRAPSVTLQSKRRDAAIFTDRKHAGRRLAQLLDRFRDDHPVVLGLPRGGVPVAFEVAKSLDAPLDVLVVSKLGVPWQPELGMGAIGEGGVRVFNALVIAAEGLTGAEVETVTAREEGEVARRVERYRGSMQREAVAGRAVILIDDGLATGFTARAAIEVLRRERARRIVLAVPVAPAETIAEMAKVADDLVCLETPEDFHAVGQFYRDFAQVTDDGVAALLLQYHSQRGINSVTIPIGQLRLDGNLTVPHDAAGMVIFAHGSGSSRLSPRNIGVARSLNNAGLGTLLFDLLTESESSDRRNVFHIDVLTQRLVGVTRWVQDRPECKGMALGYFGASTGAAAALAAAALLPDTLSAVVSRGGRPDLAGSQLPSVRAATLLIVGGNDSVVLALNRTAQEKLRCENRLAIVPNATHLFEEAGALEAVARLACDWFTAHLALPASVGHR